MRKWWRSGLEAKQERRFLKKAAPKTFVTMGHGRGNASTNLFRPRPITRHAGESRHPCFRFNMANQRPIPLTTE
jgi:hypothetical protein